MSRRYYPPDGQIIQAFTFALDPTVEQKRQISRFFGARRKAFNWTLDRIRCDLEHYRETGESGTPPSFYSLRKRWNAEKDTVCVNAETGEIWWPRSPRKSSLTAYAGPPTPTGAGRSRARARSRVARSAFPGSRSADVTGTDSPLLQGL